MFGSSLFDVGDNPLPLTIIVGTGRTGSTLLSSLLSRHPDILSLSEFFTGLGGFKAMGEQKLTGPEYWTLLTQPHSGFSKMLRKEVVVPEFSYLRGENRRFSAESGIPAISLMTLPMLTDDPDSLLDELTETVCTRGSQRLADHHRQLFGTLRARFGGSVVIERSGSSLEWVATLRQMFPEAKFVHMHRYGPDCALSMSKHAGYQTAALDEILHLCGVRSPRDLRDTHVDSLPRHLADMCHRGSLKASSLQYKIPLEHYGVMWSSMILQGVPLLMDLPAGQRTSLAYEQLVENPAAELRRIAEFAGVSAPEEWLMCAEGLVDHRRTGVAGRLNSSEKVVLVRACDPGLRLLAGKDG